MNMKGKLAVCLILICGLLPGFALADCETNQEKAVAQLVHELSLITN